MADYDLGQDNARIMTSDKLLKIYFDLENIGVKVFLDGGWGVDALLGEQTREHKDMDFMLDKDDLGKVKDFFSDLGYIVQDNNHNTPWHFIMENDDTLLDIFALEFDDEGKGILGPDTNKPPFPAQAFSGKGYIDGVEVRCLSAEFRIASLTKEYGVVVIDGYKISEKDYKDLKAIADKFNIPMPKEFEDAKADGFPQREE